MKQEEKIINASENVAQQIAEILCQKNERIIDYELIYQMIKDQIKDKNLIDDVLRHTISILEDKYGILFDLDKKVEI